MPCRRMKIRKTRKTRENERRSKNTGLFRPCLNVLNNLFCPLKHFDASGLRIASKMLSQGQNLSLKSCLFTMCFQYILSKYKTEN